MSRVEKRIYRRQKRWNALQKLLLFLSALVVTAGLAARFRGGDELQVSSVAMPTPTPIAAAYDETVETREITLPEVVWYAIQTGLYSEESAAVTRSQDYASRGAPGLVVPDNGKWRVLIASFGLKEDAAAVREKLSENQQVSTYLYAWACPELKLRMTGMAGQLDVAEAGLSQALQVAERLREAAIDLDTGEMTASEVLALLKDVQSQLQVWSATAQKRFGKPYPDLVAQELALAEAWPRQQSTIERAAREGATQLSAALKLEAMSLYGQVVAMRSGLQSS